MLERLEDWGRLPANAHLLAAAGFEDRVTRAAELLRDAGVRLAGATVLCYEGKEHQQNLRRLVEAAQQLTPDPNVANLLPVSMLQEIRDRIRLMDRGCFILADITGMSRVLTFHVLTALAQADAGSCVIYTEADSYYPLKDDVADLLSEGVSESFFRLASYEERDIVYSANCTVEEVPGFEGIHLPSYPLFLVGFLTFKRSRLSAVLQEFEPTSRVLIKGVPFREDLKWRAKMMEIVNFDLIEDHRESLRELSTLSWRSTADALSSIYLQEERCDRFNFILAPLGSKMQTLGAWKFAYNNPEVKVVTSTPSTLFPEKYSIGYRDTFIIKDLISS